MKRRKWLKALLYSLMGGLLATRCAPEEPIEHEPEVASKITLPQPKRKSALSVEEAIRGRRSRRSYAPRPLALSDAAQLLWAAQGVTDPRGYRTAPSAGALYPLETYLVAGQVLDLAPGVYRYLPAPHQLSPVRTGDLRRELAAAALGQSMIRQAPVSLVFAAVYRRTTDKYGQRGHQYVHMEAGHAAQNVYLQCESIGLATVVVGAFHDNDIRSLLGLPKDQVPLYIMPIGARRS